MPAQLTRSEWQEMYREFLTAEGYRPEIDEDGDVRFKAEGKIYFIQVNDRDPEYFRVVFPVFWAVESEEERVRVLLAADESNSRSKVSKVYIVRDNVWASVEIFLPEPQEFKRVFTRCLAALNNGVQNFVRKMRGEAI